MTQRHGQIIGKSSRFLRAVRVAERFAPSSSPILLVGATGTGKDLFAQHVHELSGRSGPFLDVNCGALPRDLMDGLLFGHRRGVFTGAVHAAAGLIEEANGGTLFLDELCSLPLEGQVKLLHVLESGEVRRLGEAKKRPVDFRLISAVQPGIAERVQSGAFRLDLYERVTGIVIELPPLVEREEDRILLAHHFVAECGYDIDKGAAALVDEYTWPGNVRELQAAIRRATMLASGVRIDRTTMADAISLGAPIAKLSGPHASGNGKGNGNGRSFQPDHVERERLAAICESHSWRASAIATALGISRTTLFRRLAKYGLSLRRGRGESR